MSPVAVTPRQASRARPRRAAVTGLPDRHEPVRVLVVEDHVELNLFIRDHLAPEFEVAGAYDGRSGIATALQWRPTIILVDVTIPDLGGLEFLRELAADSALARIPVIAMASRPDEVVHVRMLREGAVDWLVKPFGADELRARVRGHAHAQRLEAENRALRRRLAAHGGTPKSVDGSPENARVFAGQARFDLEPVDIEALVHEIVEAARSAALGKDIALQLSVPTSLGIAWLDRCRVAKALENLILRAIEGTPVGGCVDVVAERRNRAAADHALPRIESPPDGPRMASDVVDVVAISTRDNAGGLNAAAGRCSTLWLPVNRR